MRNDRHSRDSRREVQRRFPPGAFGVDNQTNSLFTAVGWIPSTTTVWITGSGQPSRGPAQARKAEKVASHDAVVLRDGRVSHVNWESMAAQWTLPEWEGADDVVG